MKFEIDRVCYGLDSSRDRFIIEVLLWKKDYDIANIEYSNAEQIPGLFG
jgi:hypothetical protein